MTLQKVTRYSVEFWTGSKWDREKQGCGFSDISMARKYQRVLHANTGCKTRCCVYETNIQIEE